MPKGVELVAMIQMEEAEDEHKAEMDLGVVSIQAPRAEEAEPEEAAEAAASDDSAESGDDKADDAAKE
jgi:hypothetical protein